MIGEVIKKSAGGSILAGVEGQILFGRVESVSPLRVTVDERLVLSGEQLILPEGLTRQIFHLRHEAQEHTMDKTFIIQKALSPGDRVILLSSAGEYLILDRVGEEEEVREVLEVGLEGGLEGEA